MTTAPAVSARPAPAGPDDGQPKDDGLFGPKSVTWRVMAGAVPSIAGPCAVAIQSLHPRTMHLFVEASSFLKDPDERGRLTQEYFRTITFGDTETAERAGQLLRNIHHHRTGTDPVSGEQYRADEPDLLLWVHCAWVWSLLRAARVYGPKLTPAEQDQFVDEQRVAARLVGIDPAKAPSTTATLNGYMRGMRPQLALTLDDITMFKALAAHDKEGPKPSPAKIILGMASADLIPPDLRTLLGIRWTKLGRLIARTGTRAIVAAVNRRLLTPGALAALRAETEQHAFGGKVRPKQ